MWVPLLAGLLNVAVMAAKLPGIVRTLYLNADTASAPVIATTAGSLFSHVVVVLGNYPWYESLWFMKATLSLPGHMVLWELAPVVWTALAFAILIRTSWSLYGGFCAAMTATVLLCVTPFLQTVFFTLETHGPLLVHASVMVGVLVALSKRRMPPGTAALVAIGVPLSVFTAAGVASDALSYVAFVLPFALAALVSAWHVGRRAQRRIAVFAIAVTCASLAGGEGLARAMRSAHWAGTPLRVGMVTPSHLGANAELYLRSFSNLAGGDFLATRVAGSKALTLLAGVLCLSALALIAYWLVREAARLVRRAPRALPHRAAETVFTTFWMAVFAGVSASFLLTSVAQDSHAGRYLANAYVALAVLVPVVVRRSAFVRKAALASGVALFALCTVLGTLREPAGALPAEVSPIAAAPASVLTPSLARRIAAFATAHGARIGYARYWDAAPITWQSRFEVRVYPVSECVAQSSTLCPYVLNAASSWYRARPRTPTFLVVDSMAPGPVVADAALGTPQASATFGSLSVEVFRYDIAAKMACGPSRVCASG